MEAENPLKLFQEGGLVGKGVLKSNEKDGALTLVDCLPLAPNSKGFSGVFEVKDGAEKGESLVDCLLAPNSKGFEVVKDGAEKGESTVNVLGVELNPPPNPVKEVVEVEAEESKALNPVKEVVEVEVEGAKPLNPVNEAGETDDSEPNPVMMKPSRCFFGFSSDSESEKSESPSEAGSSSDFSGLIGAAFWEGVENIATGRLGEEVSGALAAGLKTVSDFCGDEVVDVPQVNPPDFVSVDVWLPRKLKPKPVAEEPSAPEGAVGVENEKAGLGVEVEVGAAKGVVVSDVVREVAAVGVNVGKVGADTESEVGVGKAGEVSEETNENALLVEVALGLEVGRELNENAVLLEVEFDELPQENPVLVGVASGDLLVNPVPNKGIEVAGTTAGTASGVAAVREEPVEVSGAFSVVPKLGVELTGELGTDRVGIELAGLGEPKERVPVLGELTSFEGEAPGYVNEEAVVVLDETSGKPKALLGEVGGKAEPKETGSSVASNALGVVEVHASGDGSFCEVSGSFSASLDSSELMHTIDSL